MPDQTILDVGADKHYQTINAAIQAANAMGGNADIRIDAGTYVDDGGYLLKGIDNVTIEGVGGMAVIIDPTFNAGGKAAIVVGGQNIVIRNLDISGITVPDGNGAAVRYEGGSLLLDHVHFHDNQNGVLGAADPTGSIVITNSEFDRNGTEEGTTHNLYIGDIATFTLTDSYTHDANVGHELKSRAENNIITNNYILDNAGSSSYSIDLPNGGNATITGNVIQQGVNNQNRVINSYGEEGNLHAGTSVIFSNNTVVNDDSGGAGAVWNITGASLTGSGNTVWNAANLGNGIDRGTFTELLARPTINLPSLLAASEPSSTPSGGGDSTSSTTPVIGEVVVPTVQVLTGQAMPTFRFFDAVHGTQFLTSSSSERDAILANNASLTYEGIGMGALAMDDTDANVAPVFRFFDTVSGTHFFTTSADERASVTATRPDFIEEQSTFAEHLTPVADDVAVYRFFNSGSGDHFFTQSSTERASILSTRTDMVDEGVAFYAPGHL